MPFRLHTLLPCLALAVLASPRLARADDGGLTTGNTLQGRINPDGLAEAGSAGWQSDSIGAGRGHVDVSLGARFWTDKFLLRNFIFGGTLELAPGLRARAQFRQREDGGRFFQMDTDEAYLEAFSSYRAPAWRADVQARLGRARYLHFPYPDAIATFDLPTPLDDIDGPPVRTDYRDLLLQAEASTSAGWGLHGAFQAVLFGGRPRAHGLSGYGFYRSDFGGGWRAEGRLGALQPRSREGSLRHTAGLPGEPGVAAFLGRQIGEFHVGLLYEHLRNRPEYTGILVQFRPGPVTRALGRYRFDYSRANQGFTVQVPLYHGRIHQSRFVRSGDILVGEVRAVRIQTLFGQGITRNEYEHRLASWGETAAPGLRCVVTEEPWYLDAEALTSPHLVPDAQWERDRQGPAQFAQRVTYRFYRPFRRDDTDA